MAVDYVQSAKKDGLTLVLYRGEDMVLLAFDIDYSLKKPDFLGFGIQPPTPSWGNLLSNAQENFTKYPWLAIFPGVMIFLAIISVNYIGDGLRDAVDPYKVIEKAGEY